MNDDILVSAEAVSKKFCLSLKRSLWYGVRDVARELRGQSGDTASLRKEEFWAVDDVSFELRRGECLGLIGPNGAGKSTLLKMLNGLIKPDSGSIRIRGRVGALIELGAGFNPILTARENIYVNGSVLGLTRKEIKSRFDAIVDFAEIDRFVDTPVQNFSSGMKVRLGFAIAAQMEPDVLLIDEVLAVGDARFKAKCVSQLGAIARQTAIIFVSHSMPLVSRMASDILLMAEGREHYLGGDVAEGINRYRRLAAPGHSHEAESEHFKVLGVECNGVRVDGPGTAAELQHGSQVSVRLRFTVQEVTGPFVANLSFYDMDANCVAQCMSAASGVRFESKPGELELAVSLDEFLLNPGQYSVQLALVKSDGANRRGEILFFHRALFQVLVSGDTMGFAPVQLKGKWSHEG